MIALQRPLHSTRQGARPLFRLLAAALAVTAVAHAAEARADETTAEPKTDYCQKVTARADADAALLFAPTATAQLIRYPQSAALDTLGLQVGRDVQPRGSLSIGLVDIYKGIGVQDVAAKDCLRQETAATLQEVVLQRDEPARKVALAKKLAFLQHSQSKVDAILGDAEARFKAGTATLLEVHELRRRALELASKAADTERLVRSLEVREMKAPQESLDEMLKKYEERTMTYEDRVEHVRNLQPWKFGLTGGMTAHPNVDYFGVAELSYNIGGLFQQGAESRATEARAREIKNARYEMRFQVETLRKELATQAAINRRQVGLIDAEIARMNAERASVESTDAPTKSQVVASLTLESIDLEAERLFLSTLADRQSAIGGRQ
jgi:hypothetical protein